MIEYQRDLPADASEEAITAEEAHVRAQVAAVADADDDPTTRAEDVDVIRIRLNDGGLRIRGYLDANPDAPYLMADHEPFAGVEPELLRLFPDATGRG